MRVKQDGHNHYLCGALLFAKYRWAVLSHSVRRWGKHVANSRGWSERGGIPHRLVGFMDMQLLWGSRVDSVTDTSEFINLRYKYDQTSLFLQPIIPGNTCFIRRQFSVPHTHPNYVRLSRIYSIYRNQTLFRKPGRERPVVSSMECCFCGCHMVSLLDTGPAQPSEDAQLSGTHRGPDRLQEDSLYLSMQRIAGTFC